MKEQNLNIRYMVAQLSELSQQEQELVNRAKAATSNAYANYSHFYVGAALLLGDGRIVIGANQENAAFPSGLCAERSAIFGACEQLSRPAYPDARHSSEKRKWFPQVAYLAMRSLPPGDTGDGRPLPAPRTHPALWRERHLLLRQHQRPSPLQLRRFEHEGIRLQSPPLKGLRI